MIAAIVVYVLMVTLPLIAAAALMERALKLWRWPLRGVWAASLLATVALAGRAITRQLDSAAPTVRLFSIRSMHPIAHTQPGVLENIRMLAGTITSFPLTAAGYVARLGGSAPNAALIALWCIASLAMLGFICSVYIRIGFEKRRWGVTQLAGQRVHVAPHAGPAVVGLLRPEIVIPRWMLDAGAGDPGLVVMHEMEHRNARDPLLLAAAWGLVALIPWNPGAWYCLARTRLAIELDCDARVVERGASLRTYTQLLLNQARIRLGKPAHLWLGATSLLEPSSHLERRLNAMILSNDSSHSTPIARCLRTLGYFAVVSTVAIAACESHVPTAADISGLDAASAEANARKASVFNSQPVKFYVNDFRITADSAHAIPASTISRIMVTKGASQEVHMVTVPDSRVQSQASIPEAAQPGGNEVTVHVVTRAPGTASQQSTVTESRQQPFTGAVVIDGVSSDLAAMKSLDPSRIASIDVVKGPSAIQQSNDPRAVNGLISITLKH